METTIHPWHVLWHKVWNKSTCVTNDFRWLISYDQLCLKIKCLIGERKGIDRSYIRRDSYMFCKRYFSEEYIHTKILRELTQVIYYEWVHYESCVHYCRVWILCVHIYLLELWLWPSPDVYISFLSVVRKHGISTFLAFKWRSAVKNPRQQETSVCIWMAEISGQSSCCSSKGNDFLDCEYDLSVCALLILIYTRRLKKYANK